MPQIAVNQLCLRYRGPLLLDDVSCQIEAGQRIGLLGRNGAGKTSFLRILSGELEPDSGAVTFATNTTVSLLPQEVPQALTGRALDIVLGAAPSQEPEATWRIERRATQLLAEMQLSPEAAIESLSSGMKRRVLLARALVVDPDVLLLDEPTNHLDIDAITWLEGFLARFVGTLIFVTHDRRFLQNLATRILEIDRGRLFDWSCDYGTFLVRKADALAAEEKQNALFDKRLAEEEVWIRQGIKARRTRNEGRVRALEEMRRQRRERQAPAGQVRLAIQVGQRSGVLVAAAESIGFAYHGRPIFENFSTTIMRGDKIGIIGPNGAGKTTLIRVLLGQLSPQAGNVRLGTNLQIAYFDQLREQLDEARSVQDNVGDGYDRLQFGGSSRHVIGYLQDFLFSPERSRTPVRFLSGGERNRVLLAKLFAKPANVIVLDEPTNDLDAETLELLEEKLVEFDGTVLLVSHDRTFLNNVVTSTIVYEANGFREYTGGYDDWLRQRATDATTTDNNPGGSPIASRASEKGKGDQSTQTRNSRPATANADAGLAATKRRATFKERQERDNLPGRIEAIDNEIALLHAQLAQPDYYRQPPERITGDAARLKQLEAELAAAYERWEALEQLGE
ncbi:MAG: ATP-binding cassette domain-containing protein [Pirellulales bacterium]